MATQENREENRQILIMTNILEHPSRNENEYAESIDNKIQVDIESPLNAGNTHQGDLEQKVESPAVNISDETHRLIFLDSNETKNPSHSHDRTPESVLFEAPSTELVYCKQLSPKITPRLTKMRLNLDIPEPDPESDETGNESDKTNSMSEKITEQYDCLDTIAIPNDYGQDNILDKTISINKMFRNKSGQYEDCTNQEIVNCTETISRYEFTKQDSILPLKNLMSEDGRDNTVCGERVFLDIQSSRHVELAETFSRSTADRSQSLSASSVSRIMQKQEKSNYFDILLSAEPKTKSQACLTDIHNGMDIEVSWRSKIVPSRKQKLRQETSNEVNDFFSTRSGSPPAKRCRTALLFDNEKQSNFVLPPVGIHQPLEPTTKIQIDEYLSESTKNHLNSSPESAAFPDLPAVSDFDCKTTEMESHVTIHPNSSTESFPYVKLRKSLISQARQRVMSMVRIRAFSKWLIKKVLIFIQKGYRATRRRFLSFFIRSSKSSLIAEEELTQVISLIRSENEKIQAALTEKVALLSNELALVRTSSEASLQALKAEINEMRGASNKLADHNGILTKEFQSFTEVFTKSQMVPNCKPAQACAPPPPPPPPPPLPPPPPPPPCSQAITPTTPNSSRKRTLRTPARNSSTPLSGGRPSITVDDLLKVTLKKAPQSNKENRKNSVIGPRGPAISLDMLRSVKLKSARRKSSEHSGRSPRRSHSLRNRPASSISLSPIIGGAESPLERILRQVDVYPRRGSKRTLKSPTRSDNDLTRESPNKFDAARHSKSFSIIA